MTLKVYTAVHCSGTIQSRGCITWGVSCLEGPTLTWTDLCFQIHSHRGRVSLHHIWGSAEQTGGPGVWRRGPCAQISCRSAALRHQPGLLLPLVQSEEVTDSFVNIFLNSVFFILRTLNHQRGHLGGWTTARPSCGSKNMTSRRTTALTMSLERWGPEYDNRFFIDKKKKS